jgi:hypothetical protein
MRKVTLISLLALSFSVLNVSEANALDDEALLSGSDSTDIGDYANAAPYLDVLSNVQESAANALQSAVPALVDFAISLQPQAAGFLNLSEGFANVSSMSSNGWSFQNNSSPGPDAPANWTQGVTTTSNFPAQSGSPSSFVQVDFSSTAATLGGIVSNWLITPELDFTNGGDFSFFARTFGGNLRAELLEVRLSNAGSSTNIGTSGTSLGDFETLVGTVGDLQIGAADGAFPSRDWGLSSFKIAPSAGSGRLAFRYFATDGGSGSTDGGGDGTQAQYVAIDTVNYSAAIPEPAASSFAGFAVLGLASYFKDKRKRSIGKVG